MSTCLTPWEPRTKLEIQYTINGETFEFPGEIFEQGKGTSMWVLSLRYTLFFPTALNRTSSIPRDPVREGLAERQW